MADSRSITSSTSPSARTPSELPDQSAHTWLVTGATHGVGLEVARVAARAGARLVLPVRDAGRGQAVARELRRLGAEVVVGHLDLADLTSVGAFAAGLDEPIDVLVNNAGAVTPRRRETTDGFEMILGTNFLGPCALTNLIAGHLRGRVVIVGSGAHHSGRIDAADPHFRHRRWSIAAAYAQSKLCDMLWARALQNRLAAQTSTVDVQLAHPGWAVTNIQNATGVPVLDRAVTGVCRLIGQSAADGALPVLEAAVTDLPPLTYFGPDGFRQWRGRPEPQQTSALARDDAAAEAIWEMGVRETGTDLGEVDRQVHGWPPR
ncbi:dehydrogenase [Citricoccus zhacaiensis]|uniref:Dehydrogenase n=1 Tax=Citricoccus zhacaiensis TaxID=489142 RepID=A0ABQ2LLL5_9MICC|nr:SDR family NAD(P)-dependent oxidoreductase [Citricoccus zhacaiensis]GGO39576.1 dehydrogenase [Citricoccus zhacaiensis]